MRHEIIRKPLQYSAISQLLSLHGSLGCPAQIRPNFGGLRCLNVPVRPKLITDVMTSVAIQKPRHGSRRPKVYGPCQWSIINGQ
ncbi:hypothetical protein P152DRAFT_63194 [Eremomyces bilateralis CBS 781.70]|uniref:Uncharacterized protein n=1 Tax=Eremomyces bilateralis CBS 781.70 TaxID=1392243 RepID=A0A6G1FZR3_9PEZI|nr:uncharacterized protein P152DRAFT_63194 [Eremomyces bilateralis CBS 781.70]KAF1811160.1 hypothetical protein P152DRAFT_63194 [Eremomyces bilateralis CBS 781.70]